MTVAGKGCKVSFSAGTFEPWISKRWLSDWITSAGRRRREDGGRSGVGVTVVLAPPWAQNAPVRTVVDDLRHQRAGLTDDAAPRARDMKGALQGREGGEARQSLHCARARARRSPVHRCISSGDSPPSRPENRWGGRPRGWS